MAETTLQLGFVPKNRGEYQSTPVTRYYKDNVVQYNGSSYIADPVGWSEDDPTATYVTVPPTDESGNLNTGWKVFASGNNTFTTGEKVDNVGIDDEPTAESNNLVKSGGVYGKISQLGQEIGILPFERIQHLTGQAVESESGNRYSLLFNVVAGMTLTCQCNWQSGVIAGIWENRTKALYGGAADCLQSIMLSYTNNKIIATVTQNGVLRISGKKENNSAFTTDDITNFNDSLIFFVSRVDSVLPKLADEIIKNKTDIEALPVALGFTAVHIDGIINANNTTKKFEIPPIIFFDENGSHQISNAQEISYNWGSNNRIEFALVVSDDYSTYQMVEWTAVTTKSKVIAFIRRSSSGSSNVSVFYGAAGNSIFAIDGFIIKNEISKLDTIGNRNYGYPNAAGNWFVATAYPYISHIPFQVVPGNEIRILAGNFYTFVGYLKTYPNRKLVQSDNNTPIDYSSIEGYTERIQIQANTEYVGTVPADANYIIVTLGNDIEHDLDVQYVSVDGKTVYLRDLMLVGSLEELKGDVYELEDKVGAPLTLSDLNYGPLRHNASSFPSSPTGDRYSIGFDIKRGKYLRIYSNYIGAKIAVQIWDNWQDAVIAPGASQGKLWQNLTQSYVAPNTIVEGISEWDSQYADTGVLIIKFKKDDGSAITDEEMAAMYASLSVEIIVSEVDLHLFELDNKTDSLESRVSVIEEQLTEEGSDANIGNLYVGPLAQNTLDSNGHLSSASTTSVVTKSAVMVPYYGAKIHIKMPEDYCVKVYDGYSTTDLTDNLTNISNWLHDGDIFEFATSYQQIYRLMFGKNDGVGNVTVEEISRMLKIGEILLAYENYGNNVVLANSQNEGYIKNIMRKWHNVLSQDDSLTKMPTFTHLSDIHGDVVRFENFVKYSESLGVDAGFVSGDLVPMDGYYDKVDFINDIIDKHDVMTLLCMGNHDARQGTTAQIQNEILAHNIAKYDLTTPTGVEYPTYYYKDFASKSIRLIALNLYMPGQYNTNYARFTQEQLDWLVTTLSSTPAGYGVIIMMHAPEVATTKDTNYAKFWNLNDNGSAWPAESFSNASPIAHIVDAFISRQSNFSYSFTETRSGGTDEIVVTADFSSVATGVEFVCYVTGHHHRDRIGYVSGTNNKQLMCNICLGIGLYGNNQYNYYAEEMDCPRGGKGVTQDAFNVYVIDRTAKTVRVARVGSNMLPDFTMRDYMIIPYAD